MEKITKKELVAKVAEQTNNTKKDIDEVIAVFLDDIVNELKAGNEVELYGFGKFSIKTRSGRTGVNPRTKEPIEIAESKNVGFKPARSLKETISK